MSATAGTAGFPKIDDSDVAGLEGFRDDFLFDCLLPCEYLVDALHLGLEDELEFIVDLVHCLFTIVDYALVLNVGTVGKMIALAGLPWIL